VRALFIELIGVQGDAVVNTKKERWNVDSYRTGGFVSNGLWGLRRLVGRSQSCTLLVYWKLCYLPWV